MKQFFPHTTKNLSFEIKEALEKDFIIADKKMLFISFLSFLGTALITSYSHNTYFLGIVGGGITFTISLIAYIFYKGTLISRLLFGIVFMIYPSIMVQQQLGMIEMHFAFFYMVSFFMMYKDISPILISMFVVTIHHVVLTYLQLNNVEVMGTPLLIFGPNCSWTITSIHLTMWAFALVVYMYMIIKNTQQFIKIQIRNIELKTTNNELETIIKEAPNPIILHEEGGKIIMLNQAWINSSGYSLEETPTIDAWVEHIHNDKKSIISLKKHIYSLYDITEKVDEGEFSFLNKNGDLVTWQFSSAPLGMIDGKRTVISSAMDITELKKKDEMLINQSRHAAMGEMIGMIAHQWRQPISAIAMDANNILLDIALKNLNNTEAGKYANSITQQTQHLSHTIDDFRNFFKPDKVISEVNIKETIDSTLSIVKDSLRNNNIEVTSSYETDKKVKAYPRELMQVFVNIITNSKDVLTLNKPDNASITIRVYEDEKYINTEICDNGGGIDADILPKVFDPYFSTKDEKTGTGLGLYMSKMIIQEHLNGSIEAYNINEGACFRVSLLKKQIGKG
jgi:PAS domain S-box-containing protein